jgi:hypothetical protein
MLLPIPPPAAAAQLPADPALFAAPLALPRPLPAPLTVTSCCGSAQRTCAAGARAVAAGFTKSLPAGIGAGAGGGKSWDGCRGTVAIEEPLTGAGAGAAAGLGGEAGFGLLSLDGLRSSAAVMGSMPNHPFFFGGGAGAVAGGSSARLLSASASAAFRSSSSCGGGLLTRIALREF